MKRFRWFFNPPVLCGLRCVLPGGRAGVRGVRDRMRRDAFPGRTGWKSWLLRTAFTISWLALCGWLAWGRGLRMATRSNVSRQQAVPDLFHLIFWLGAHPRGYFAYRLHARPRSDWVMFIHPQEQSTWQSARSRQDASGRAILADKDGMARRLREAGLPSVPTLHRWEAGTSIDLDEFADRGTVFLKANSANAMRGCFELLAGDEGFRLSGKTLDGHRRELTKAKEIARCLNELARETDVLMQPRLRNHAAMRQLVSVERLITLRVISVRRSTTELLYAVLEVPTDKPNAWLLANINAVTGEVSESRNQVQPNEKIRDAIGKVIPQWDICRDIVRRAHGLVPDLMTVGWDLAMAESGPVIIEGNSGWDVVPPQAVSGVPLLRALEPDLERWQRG